MLSVTYNHGFMVAFMYIITSLYCPVSVTSGENDISSSSIPTTNEQWDGLNFEEHFNISQQPAPPEGQQMIIFDLGQSFIFWSTS